MLILIRHALPVIDSNAASERWVLAPEGREATGILAHALTAFGPSRILCGAEPKMLGTAEALSGIFGVAVEPDARLSEHQRRSTRFTDKDSFEAAIKALFDRPGEVVYGEESADMTYARFAAAVDEALSGTQGTVVAVSGGTAISIFLSRRSGVDAYSTWKGLRLPMAFVLDRGTWAITQIL